MEIFEKPEENSGLPQGKMIGRHRIPINQKSERLDLPFGVNALMFTTKASLGIPKGENKPLDRHATSSPSRANHHVGNMNDVGTGLFSTTGAGGTRRQAPKSSTKRSTKPGAEDLDEREYYDWRDLVVGNELYIYGR